MLNELINNTEKELISLYEIKDLLRDLECQNIIRQLHIDMSFFLNDFPSEFNGIYDFLSINDNFIELKKGYYIDYYKFSYYELLEHKDVEITYRNELRSEYSFKKEYKGKTFTIGQNLWSKIPEEEMELLESIGKVEVEYIKASKTKTIFCPN